MASAAPISAGWITRSRAMRAAPLWVLSSSLLWLHLAGPVCASSRRRGGQWWVPEPSGRIAGAAVPRGGCRAPVPPQGSMSWAPAGSWDRAAPCLPGAPEYEPVSHKPLSKLLCNFCWFAEPVPTLQPPNHGAQLLEHCGGEAGTHGSHLPLGRGARGLRRQEEEEEIQEGEGSRSRLVGNQSSRGQRADVGVVMSAC